MSNKNGAKWITRKRRLTLYSRDGFCCVYCLSQKNLTLDHLKPRSKNGNDSDGNLVTACYSCNSARGDKSWWLFANDDAKRRITVYRRRGTHRRGRLAKRLLNCMSWQEILHFIGQ